MAMKKLQNNFTTPEQSRRLLELRVPRWTADCTIEKEIGGSIWRHIWVKHEWDKEYDAKDYQNFLDRNEKHTMPCWSVGRLMEIFEICTPYYLTQFDFTGSYVERIIKTFEAIVGNNYNYDFSKLEEEI